MQKKARQSELTPPKIEKGVAIPTKNRRGLHHANSFYSFHLLEIGDSIHMPTKTGYINMMACASQYKKRSGGKFNFTSRRDADGEGGRLWRVALHKKKGNGHKD